MSMSWPKSPLSSEDGRRALRQAILESIFLAKSGHPGGSLSMVEILSTLFDGHFKLSPKEPHNAENDRFVLSKGHGVPAYYAVLSYLGFFDSQELAGLRHIGHFLQGHPDRLRYPMMEASTGSLGQGASVALGLAMGLRENFRQSKIKRLPHVYCVLGDGEIQEGQVWECLMSCGKFRPGNLTFVLDYNKGQIDGSVEEVMPLEPLEEKLRAFNLDVSRIDGHDVAALHQYYGQIRSSENAPVRFLIADTLKGKGISFMEHPNKWHGVAPTREELDLALVELYNNEMPFGTIRA